MSWRRHLRPSLAALGVYDVPPAQGGARLHANECPEPWPAHVMQALGEIVAGLELNRYPDTSGRTLRRVLADQHACDPDRVVLGNGSDEIISILLTALSGDREPVLVTPAPTFVMYAHSARVLGYQVREVPLDPALELDPAAMRQALAGATVCFLARPNNPTSSLWDRALIRALIAEFPDTVFVVDEAYTAYAPGESLWRPDAPDNYVHMATLSKVGLAALRVGYAIACPDLALALNKVRHPYNVSQTSLALAQAVLTRFADVQANMIATAIQNRDRLVEILGKLPDAHVYPAHGNKVLVRLRDDARAQALVAGLADRDVRIKDVSGVPGLSGCVRVSVGTREELDLLERALGELG
jgi:histidinol-phosphate aminotransferase